MQAEFMENTTLGNNKWDIVVLRHVLEHFPDSVIVMNRIRDLLSPRRYALIEVHNIDSWELKSKRFLSRYHIFKKKYSKNFVPGHCNEFCKDSFSYLMKKTGFKLISWQTYSHKPAVDLIYKVILVGNKVRAIIQKER